jgi:hypothetical protein
VPVTYTIPPRASPSGVALRTHPEFILFYNLALCSIASLTNYKRHSPEFEELHGKYLNLNNNTVGVYGGGRAADALRFYALETKVKGLYEFHTWPIGFVDHALGLVGTEGLFTFQDLTNPRKDPETGVSTTSVGGEPTAWTQFTLGGIDPQTGASTPKVSFGTPDVSFWAVWPAAQGHGAWDVKWYDGMFGICSGQVNDAARTRD